MSLQSFRYTDDGRKVVVIAPLNAKETIVQEVFVSYGQEIPSGENFVAKNLHDSPAVSWKEKNLAELELRYERRKLEIERGLDNLNRRNEEAQREATAFIREKLHWRKNIKVDALDTLYRFLNDEITHIVKFNYGDYEILPFKKSLLSGEKREENLKLISLFGSSEGNLDWRLNYYRDGSGGWDTIIPCSSLEEAQQVLIEKIQCKAKESGVTRQMIDTETKYAIRALTNEQKKDFYIKSAQAKKSSIEKLKIDSEKLEAEVEELIKLGSAYDL